MKKHISYFLMNGNEAWPPEIEELFRENKANDGASFHFIEPANQRFVELCDKHDIGAQVSIREILACTQKELPSREFFHLNVAMDNPYLRKDVIDYSDACTGSGGLRCGVGGRQIEKIEIDEKKSKKLDIFKIMLRSMPLPYAGPGPYIVSKRLKESLATQDFGGFYFIPCLRQGSEYSAEERDFNSSHSHLEEDAQFFQLLVQADSTVVPEVGFLSQWNNCETCGVTRSWQLSMKGGFSERIGSGQTGDLLQVKEISAQNIGNFQVKAYPYIISSKLLKFLVDGKFQGIVDYSKEWKIQFAAFEEARA